MAQFEYTKEMIFAEFADAKAKDTKLGKGDDNKVHKHRVAMLKDFVNLKKTNPEALENVDINFDNLLHAYIQTNLEITSITKYLANLTKNIRLKMKLLICRLILMKIRTHKL